MASSGRDSNYNCVGEIMNEEGKPLHKRRKSISASLGPDLREEHGFRSISVRVGDKVRIMRGDFKGMEGEVTEVETDSQRLVVEGVETATADETEVPSPVHPSNVEIIELEKDNMRDKIIERRSEHVEKRREETSEENERTESEESS